MAVFDISKKWQMLAPASIPAAWNAATELASYISLLRIKTGLGKDRPRIEDAETVSPPLNTPLVLLNASVESRDRNGFTWRLGRNRLEFLGDSDRGLWNGIFDFLAALGFRWPKPGQEELPAPPTAGAYPLKDDRAYHPSTASVQDRRRLIIGEQTTTKERETIARWAARNKYDALVFSLREKSFWNKVRRRKGIYQTLEYYALVLEAGGGDMSLLLPRRLFFLHQNMFRMDSGVRTRRYHFCPTNPKTITRIKEHAAELFSQAMPGMAGQAVPVFHLWPEAGHEKTWCACPACRAFSPAEQNRIAINSAADVLESLDPAARLSYLEDAEETKTIAAVAEPGGGIVPRNNTFVVSGR
jgi:hypothetical protein